MNPKAMKKLVSTAAAEADVHILYGIFCGNAEGISAKAKNKSAWSKCYRLMIDNHASFALQDEEDAVGFPTHTLLHQRKVCFVDKIDNFEIAADLWRNKFADVFIFQVMYRLSLRYRCYDFIVFGKRLQAFLDFLNKYIDLFY